MSNDCIYLDYNATTPLSKEVLDTMLPFLTEHFGNASSGHPYGRVCKEAIKKARKQVADLINAQLPEEEIVFSGGGTEGINFIVFGVARDLKKKGRGNHIITSDFEHWAVSNALAYLEREEGFEITRIPVGPEGKVKLEDIQNAFKPTTILVTIMHANNEIGSIQPVAEIAALCHQQPTPVLFHTDASQTAGKIPIDVQASGIDLLNLAAHKFYGPKGIGASYVRKGIDIGPYVFGAKQERCLRGGTENVSAIVGMGTACEIALRDFEANTQHNLLLRERLFNGIKAIHPSTLVHGLYPTETLPNTINVAFPGIRASDLMQVINNDVGFSAGAACHVAGVVSGSLAALKVPVDIAVCSVRLSVGKMLTEEAVDRALGKFREAFATILSRSDQQ